MEHTGGGGWGGGAIKFHLCAVHLFQRILRITVVTEPAVMVMMVVVMIAVLMVVMIILVVVMVVMLILAVVTVVVVVVVVVVLVVLVVAGSRRWWCYVLDVSEAPRVPCVVVLGHIYRRKKELQHRNTRYSARTRKGKGEGRVQISLISPKALKRSRRSSGRVRSPMFFTCKLTPSPFGMTTARVSY
jgi:cell division protein FtsW (lipid II flippase)